MFSAFFFVVMALLINPHIRARKVRTGAASDVELGVSLNQNQMNGRSIYYLIDEKFFDG
ncbi:hypothetical protein [Candidatus Enterovibrio altilux]|uniref:Uncharacterized protein n=1 Tax=Candidatus Enterovibrio altilux TaxID=1927128 RepID=A0A291BAL8_9GAMM|nr:hypothetical protein [Candidatus Enterovibrio luxaltus]ATF10059.1 hypothetical protein BTN50_1618 [Candidatus Enterovibrio luxaltus]